MVLVLNLISQKSNLYRQFLYNKSVKYSLIHKVICCISKIISFISIHPKFPNLFIKFLHSLLSSFLFPYILLYSYNAKVSPVFLYSQIFSCIPIYPKTSPLFLSHSILCHFPIIQPVQSVLNGLRKWGRHR